MYRSLTVCQILAVSMAMDTRVKVCWNVAIPADFFCAGSVHWAIAEDVFYDAKTRDDCKYKFIPNIE